MPPFILGPWAHSLIATIHSSFALFISVRVTFSSFRRFYQFSFLETVFSFIFFLLQLSDRHAAAFSHPIHFPSSSTCDSTKISEGTSTTFTMEAVNRDSISFVSYTSSHFPASLPSLVGISSVPHAFGPWVRV